MLDLATVAFNVHWIVGEQIRLLRKHLRDTFTLTVYDNSSLPVPAWQISNLCNAEGIRYVRSPSLAHSHEEALQHACEDLLNRQAPWIGFLDHDVVPVRATSLLGLAEPGFFGLGQRHEASQQRYLWPGLCVFERRWLAGRRPDFGHITAERRQDVGDTGSATHVLFSDDDWGRLPEVKHGYLPLRGRAQDGVTQSWAVEQIGDWLHVGNTSGWLKIADPAGRECLVREMLAKL